MTPEERIASLTKALAVERAMNGLKLKPGVSVEFARLAVEREVSVDMEAYPTSFDPACPETLKGISERSAAKCPALFGVAGSGSAAGSGLTEAQARAAELKAKGII